MLPSSAYSTRPPIPQPIVVSSPVFEVGCLAPGVHEQEGAGSVGVLRPARGEAALAEERRLLVTRDARNGNLRAEPFGIRRAKDPARIPHLGQHGAGDAEFAEQQVVPVALVDVVEQRA